MGNVYEICILTLRRSISSPFWQMEPGRELTCRHSAEESQVPGPFSPCVSLTYERWSRGPAVAAVWDSERKLVSPCQSPGRNSLASRRHLELCVGEEEPKGRGWEWR